MDQLQRQLLRNFSRFSKLATGVIKDGPGGFGPGKTGPGKGRFIVMSAAYKVYCEKEDHRIQVGDIVEMLHIPAPAVSRALRDLEKDGVLLRETDPKDRRITLVTFTAEGLEHVRACTGMVDSLFDRATARMGEAKVRELCALLEEFYDCMEGAAREIAGQKDGI